MNKEGDQGDLPRALGFDCSHAQGESLRSCIHSALQLQAFYLLTSLLGAGDNLATRTQVPRALEERPPFD